MVLVPVLWAIAFCSILAMAASTTFRGLTGIIAIDRDREQADALMSAGLEVAAGIVANMKDAPLTERGTTLTLSTGSVRIEVSDEGGRIDIGKAPAELLASLLRYVGADDDDADIVSRRIVEQRAPEQKAAPNEAGKPRTPAASPVPAAEAAASPPAFTDIRQLARIPGMRPEWITAMAPLITVYGSDTVNPLTAPIAVIRALPFFDEARLDSFLDMRSGTLVDAERLAFVLGPAQKYLKVGPRRVVAVDLVAGTADGYTAAAKAFIVLLSGDKQPYRVLAWNPVPRLREVDAAVQIGAR
jgi:general secretion pathway protein K